MKKLFLIIGLLLGSLLAKAQQEDCCFGLRFGIGSDLSLGISYRVEIDYRLVEDFEFGLLVLGTSSLRTKQSGNDTYTESRRMSFFGGVGSWLFYHRPDEIKPYYLLSVGGGLLSYQKTGYNPNRQGHVSYYSSPYYINTSAEAIMFGFGVGYTIKSPLDLALDLPLIIPLTDKVGPIPLFMLTVGFKF